MSCLSRCTPSPSIAIFVAIILIALVPQFVQGQSSPSIRKAQQIPPPPAEDQEQFISYWTAETAWRTELQLRNNQLTQFVTVTPVLRAADGTETALSPAVVQPQEAQTLDLTAAIDRSAPHLVGAYGSLVLRYRASGANALYAAVMIMGIGRSVAFHIDGTGEDQAQEIGSREGIWWLPNESVNDYLILTNQGRNPLQASLSVFDSSGKASARMITLAPRGMARYSIRQIVSASGLTGSYGGITVSAVSHAGSLDTLHIAFDPTGGFSAVMKMFDYDPRVQLKERDFAHTGKWALRAPMLALSNPDPSLAFPADTVLQPQLFLRNVASKPVEASLAFNWRTAGTTGKAAGPVLHLAPYETRRVDVAALQSGKTIPQAAQWTSVILTTNSLPGEVVAVTASYDQTLRYGAQTPFSDVLAFHYAGSQWQYDSQHDSIITVGNGGTQPTRAALTIFYNQGTQKYELEQTLQPDEQMWTDVGKLIRERSLDKNGQALPADLTSGSYEIRNLGNHSVPSLFEGKIIYDKTYGHVTYGCQICCSYQRFVMFSNPLNIADGGTAPNGVNGLDSCSQQYINVSGDFDGNWSTASSSIATVDCCGTFTGQGVGATTSSTFANEQWYISKYSCPVQQRYARGSDNVAPTIAHDKNLWFFGSGIPTPSGFTLGATSATLTANGAGNGTYVWTITTGTAQVEFSDNNSSTITKTNINTVGIKSIFESTSANDVTIQLQFTPSGGSQVTTSISLEVDSPYKLASGGAPSDYGIRAGSNCTSTTAGTDGYVSYIPYIVFSFFGQQITNIEVNEAFGVRHNDSSNNWASPIAGGDFYSAGTFSDCILAVGPGLTPSPEKPQSPLLSQAVMDLTQTWYIGSETSGSGIPVQFDNITYFQDHGRHLSITSPVR